MQSTIATQPPHHRYFAERLESVAPTPIGTDSRKQEHCRSNQVAGEPGSEKANGQRVPPFRRPAKPWLAGV